MKNVLIIGAGEFGSHVAKRMSELHCDVMLVDINEKHIQPLLPYVTSASIGDSTNEEFLKTLGVANFDLCVVALGSLFQSSLETTSLLKELGAQWVVSRATNDVQMKFLLKNGADEVVYPEKQTALRIATKYASDSILDFVQLDCDHSIFEVKIPKDWAGKTLSQIDIRKKYGINVLTIRRGGNIIVPSADTKLEADDAAFIMGEEKVVEKYFRV